MENYMFNMVKCGVYFKRWIQFLREKILAKTSKKQVIAYLHTHWDREWYRTKEEFNLRLLEVFDEILEELESGSMPCFYFDGQTAALEDYLKFRPEKLDLVRSLIEKKRLFTGPFYVSADSFLVNGISLVRNLAIGMEYSKSLGESEFLGYLPDTFGHSRSIFDILKSFNIPYALAWRGIPALEHNDFKMNGINTTKLPNGYFMDVLHNISAFSPASNEFKDGVCTLVKILDKIARNSSETLLLPVGADHLAGLLNSEKLIKNVNSALDSVSGENGAKYEIKLSSPFEYVKNVKYSGLDLKGEFLDNSETYILPGVYSSRMPQKALNARLQWELFRITEPFNFFFGGKYAPSLDYAVKELIKNHAHDSIYGCSTDAVHRHVEDRFNKVFEVCDGVKHRLIRDFKRRNGMKSLSGKDFEDLRRKKSKKTPEKFGLFNFSNFEFSGPIKVISDFKLCNAQLIRKFRGFSDEILYDTRQIPVTEQYLERYEYLIEPKSLQPFSFSVFENADIKSLLEISGTKISNGRLELSLVRKKGDFAVNLSDKKTGVEYSDALKILVTEDIGDSYNFAPKSKPHSLKLFGAKVIEKGPVRAALRLLYENNFHLDVFLSNTSEFFEFRAKFNNNKKNRKIQACIKLKNPIDTTFAEDAFGYIERKHDPDLFLLDNMPAVPRIELKTNSYPMQRWCLAQSLGVFTVGLNEYEIYKNELKITLHRGTARISEPHNGARFVPAGPPIETPGLQCLGLCDVKFGCALNADISSIERLTEIFYEPVVPFVLQNSGFNEDWSKNENLPLNNFKTGFSKKFLDLPENLRFYGLKPDKDKVFGVFYNTGNEDIIFKNKTIPLKTIEYIEIEPIL